MTGALYRLSRELAEGKTTARELTERSLSRIAETEQTLNAFITVDCEGARRAAAESDARRAAGAPRSPFDGIPYAAKDNFETAGLRTTCASKLLEHHIPSRDAAAVETLRRAGFVLVGKTNMDEFAMGSVTAASAFGASHNPHDPARTCGGSSGGSAAAVAVGDVTAALGSDTGGSVRQPAAFCRTVGVKPTYGRLSRRGLTEFAPSLDTVGIVAETVTDAAVLTELLSDGAESCTDRLGAGVHGLRVGVIFDGGNTDAVNAMLENAARVLTDGGARVERVAFPFREEAAITYRILAYAEGVSTLSEYGKAASEDASAEARGAGFGYEVKRRLLFGALMASETEKRTFAAAQEVRGRIRAQYTTLFEGYDVLLRATAPFGAFRLDKRLTAREGCDMDFSTVCESLAGVPALSVPFGSDADGMPLGVQVAAPWMRDSVMFGVGNYLEERKPR
ncbi:MAG TPA: Asp-tRNA(Asn)/Glu-tRNA(Gln) amidotransferase subunit GatA [Clostridiales bacterium]|nr:Asp-tRNA(Asn)/Glu-tRNA(Gln) amidotransferase subunit GatA [Clostridiales bacterium]